MKFTCNTSELQNAVNIASKTVSSKSTMPALEGILFEAGIRLRLTGYNLETGITTEIQAKVSESGSIVIEAKLLTEIVRKLPDDIVEFVVNDKNGINIKSGISEYNLMGINADDYPELPDVSPQFSLSIEQRKLKSMIGQTVFAVSDNQSRPIHTGSLYEVEGNIFTIVAVDGFRLALRRESVTNKNGDSFSFVVPGTAQKEVEKIVSDSEEMVTISMGSRHIMFTIDDTILICRLLEGDFFDFKKSIPRNNPIGFFADTLRIRECVERVSLIINDKLKSPVRCTFDNGMASFKTNSPLGNAYDECSIEGDGLVEIGFNNRYLLECLKSISADKIKIELKDGLSPCLIVPAEGEESFLNMVLPLRLKG